MFDNKYTSYNDINMRSLSKGINYFVGFGAGGGGSVGRLTGLLILLFISAYAEIEWLGGGGALLLGTKSISSSSFSVDNGLMYGDLFLFPEMYFDT